ncbi:hypothetical protein TREMEDRAFT_60541 [Tremella mesenterica DSM 1558]|uniref:uncharacterized protein n=1 Tax=Tremella mesenterica (strain ATCC 24925 / CBS 8224 / DSM 1558 / NBRC 9311 / NRRL Y-6157 / RJB 2259-6 / UBC 559-6) TaxID=578456 RepID=UPI0003F4A2D9|nr:uncharacterized protein TREMEDRAFT_60541 [Tremella mesenterica DSM 1558]EIW71619.1 hypothetical protein TREMEDRAFT_60541 [Tremella mesenterica DSM 1558]
MSFSTSGYEIDDLLKFLEDAIKGSRQLRIGQPVLLDVDWEGLSYYGVGHATHDLDVRGKRNAYYHAVLHDLIMHLETQSLILSEELLVEEGKQELELVKEDRVRINIKIADMWTRKRLLWSETQVVPKREESADMSEVENSLSLPAVQEHCEGMKILSYIISSNPTTLHDVWVDVDYRRSRIVMAPQTPSLRCCIMLPAYNKCVCCAGECSFAPSADTMAEMLCLQSAASTIRAVMSVVESDKTDKASRKAAAERVGEAMELVARVAVRTGGVLDKKGKKVLVGEIMSEGFGQYEFERHRKPKAPAPHPSSSRNVIRRKLAPPLPPVSSSSHPGAINGRQPNLPLKTLQGLKTRRTDSTKAGYGREVVLVTRKSGLGTLIGRCRSLVLDEGYTTLTLHALSAAIPHALLLLHALLDILPYPKGSGGMWYEIKTGSVECVDEVSTLPDLSNPTGLEGEEEFPGVGAIEEDEPELIHTDSTSYRTTEIPSDPK